MFTPWNFRLQAEALAIITQEAYSTGASLASRLSPWALNLFPCNITPEVSYPIGSLSRTWEQTDLIRKKGSLELHDGGRRC
jgi:hypothetical protein